MALPPLKASATGVTKSVLPIVTFFLTSKDMTAVDTFVYNF